MRFLCVHVLNTLVFKACSSSSGNRTWFQLVVKLEAFLIKL